jgi:hypothetical protein
VGSRRTSTNISDAFDFSDKNRSDGRIAMEALGIEFPGKRSLPTLPAQSRSVRKADIYN